MLSSATLFHFTRNLETLKKILSEGFKPFYSSEDLEMFGVSGCPGIPMVSFCDIPLSLAKQHVRDYGRYAIGLNKKWGMKRNISPVHYIYEDSICARVMSTVYDALPVEARHADCSCMKFNAQTAIFFYGKPYRGRLLRKDRKGRRKVTFYDEREWRYVPFADQTIKEGKEIPADVRTLLSEKEYKDTVQLANASTSLHNYYKLTFAAEDVRYLIVDKEREIPELIDFINGLRGASGNDELKSCPADDRKRLTSRLLSMREIEQDF